MVLGRAAQTGSAAGVASHAGIEVSVCQEI